MKNVIICNKVIGETPLECLERIRIENGIDKSVSMTYAGRLDPMAEGMLIILIGEECKNKDKYTGLDKEYEIEVLFGLETDSYDILGLIKNININKINKIELEKYIGRYIQKYPRYSSKIIAMKEIPDEIPSKEVQIYSINKLVEIEKSGEEIARESIEKIKKVKGDFRQEKIIDKWEKYGKKFAKNQFKIIKLKVVCSSGTYMRSLADRIGKDMGIGAIAYSIKRTKIMLE